MLNFFPYFQAKEEAKRKTTEEVHRISSGYASDESHHLPKEPSRTDQSNDFHQSNQASEYYNSGSTSYMRNNTQPTSSSSLSRSSISSINPHPQLPGISTSPSVSRDYYVTNGSTGGGTDGSSSHSRANSDSQKMISHSVNRPVSGVNNNKVSLPPGIPLTGDAKTDADIMAFFKARQKALGKS